MNIKELHKIQDSFYEDDLRAEIHEFLHKGRSSEWIKTFLSRKVVPPTEEEMERIIDEEKGRIEDYFDVTTVPVDVKKTVIAVYDRKIRRIRDASSTDLKNQILALGLNPEGKSVAQMESMISMALWAKDHPNEEFPDQFDPMLAKDSTKADKDWIKKNFTSSGWYLQEKINGMRSILTLKGDSVRMTSRARSVKDFQFTPHQDNVLGFQNLVNPFKGKTVLDGELVCTKARIDTGSTITESTLQATVALVHMNPPDSLKIQEREGSLRYKAFDILFFDGQDVQELPYDERETLVATAVRLLQEANPELPIDPVETIKDYDDAYQIFQDFLKKGAEGIMVKYRKGKYKQGNRSSELLKLKGFVTIDGFITGMVQSSEGKGFADLIGGFQISAFVDGVQQEIAAVSNIPNDVRKAATLVVDGKPTLNPEYINKCVELIGQEFGRNGRLGSARINEWRPDKAPEDCKLTKEEIQPPRHSYD